MVSLKYVQANDSIIVMRIIDSPFNQSNVVCIELEDGLAFVDASLKAVYTSKFRSEMEERFGKKASMLFLTHTHWDHYFGIDAFSDLPIIVSQVGLESLAKSLEEELSEEGRVRYLEAMNEQLAELGPLPEGWEEDWVPNYLNAKLSRPTMGVKDEMTVGSEKRLIQFRVVGGHTDCSAYLYVEPDRVLLSGDNLVAEHAKNSTCMLALLKPSCMELLKLFEDIGPSKIIPGHGPIVETDYVRTSREWFSAMFAKLRSMKDAGVTLENAVKDARLHDFFEPEKHTQWDRILNEWYQVA